MADGPFTLPPEEWEKLLLAGGAELGKEYRATIKLLDSAILHPSNAFVSLWGMVIYADLLHGGRYRWPANYPTPNDIGRDAFMLQFPSIYVPNVQVSFFGLVDPDPITKRVFENTNIPHIFPKLLSDEAYEKILGWADKLTGAEFLQSIGTGVTTVVQAASSLEEAVTGKPALRIPAKGD